MIDIFDVVQSILIMISSFYIIAYMKDKMQEIQIKLTLSNVNIELTELKGI
jgi:hypothetical protein